MTSARAGLCSPQTGPPRAEQPAGDRQPVQRLAHGAAQRRPRCRRGRPGCAAPPRPSRARRATIVGSSQTSAPATLPTRCGSWSSSTRSQVRAPGAPGRRPGHRASSSRRRPRRRRALSRSPNTTYASSAPAVRQRLGRGYGGAAARARRSAMPAARRGEGRGARWPAARSPGRVEGRAADDHGGAGLAHRLDLPAGQREERRERAAQQHGPGPELVDVPDQALGRGVRAEVADREAVRAQVLGDHQRRAGRATPARRRRPPRVGRPPGREPRRLALDGQRGQHRLADGGGGVLLRDAPAVADPQLVRPAAGRGRAACWIRVEHVVAVGAERPHLPQGARTVAACRARRGSGPTCSVQTIAGHWLPARLDGEDRDVVVRPVARCARQGDRDALDLGARRRRRRSRAAPPASGRRRSGRGARAPRAPRRCRTHRSRRPRGRPRPWCS